MTVLMVLLGITKQPFDPAFSRIHYGFRLDLPANVCARLVRQSFWRVYQPLAGGKRIEEKFTTP